jgi:hypothetical protein
MVCIRSRRYLAQISGGGACKARSGEASTTHGDHDAWLTVDMWKSGTRIVGVDTRLK